MQKALLGIIGLLLLPSFVGATGFAQGSLFLSKTSVTEGETVLIHAVVANYASEEFEGTLVLIDGTEQIGSVPVTLAGGEAQTASVSWKPTAGSHPITAQLQSQDGEVVEEESKTFSIKKKPEPEVESSTASTTQTTEVQSSENIQQQIANVSPQVAEVAQPVFSVIDSGREGVANVINKQITETRQKLSGEGEVSGAETGEEAASTGGLMYLLYTIYLYVLTLLKFLVSSAGIFYPVFAVALLYGLWRLYRRMRDR